MLSLGLRRATGEAVVEYTGRHEGVDPTTVAQFASCQIVSEGLQSEAHETPEPTGFQPVVIQFVTRQPFTGWLGTGPFFGEKARFA